MHRHTASVDLCTITHNNRLFAFEMECTWATARFYDSQIVATLGVQGARGTGEMQECEFAVNEKFCPIQILLCF